MLSCSIVMFIWAGNLRVGAYSVFPTARGTTKRPGRDGPDGGVLQDEKCMLGTAGDDRKWHE